MIAAMSLIVVFAMAAPVPKGAAADGAVVEPTGPPPHFTYLKADAAGNIFINVARLVPVETIRNGAKITNYVSLAETVEIRLFKDAITTPDGAKVTPDDAHRKLRNGGYVAFSSDGKAVSAGYLRMLNRDVLVFTARGLVPFDPNRAVVAPPRIQPRPAPVPNKD